MPTSPASEDSGPATAIDSNPGAPTVELLEEFMRRFRNWDRWGPNDERGTLNFLTAERVRGAARLVRRGDIYSLQLPMDGAGPQTGSFNRHNPIHVMTATGTDHTAGAQTFPLGFGYADDAISTPLQAGTQWDGLAHIFHKGVMYGGRPAVLVDASGAAVNDVCAMATLAGRGVLLDLPLAVGRPLEPGEPISPAMLDTACRHHDVTVGAGDILLLRTGQMHNCLQSGNWGDYAGGDAPGISLSAIPWIAQRELAGLATDTWGVEVRPNELAGSFQPVHLVMIVNMGLAVGEIWYLDELAAACASDGCYEFLLVAPALKIPRAVGSPVNPQAIR